MHKKKSVTAVFILLAATSLFSFDGAVDAKNNGSLFNLDPILEGILFASSAGLNGIVLYFDKVGEVNHSKFDGNIIDSSQVNGFDQLLMNSYSSAIDKLGTYFGIVSILTPTILLVAPMDQWLTIGTMYAETITLAYGFKELGKICINKARPYMYFEGFPKDAVNDHDWNKSFPSGHTTMSFAGASFTSLVFSKYFPNSKWKIPVIASSYVIAFSTAACRVASGDHFLTDVIAGAIAGTACGFFVPWIHSLNINTQKVGTNSTYDVSVQAIPMGAVLSIKY
ncbi:phosphatase PAP2 family protein [Sediminispirochaeta bajacaliforniensis]|uniref:phosphatase PAP2 family protein n=1 Tax=Sediminispirochaeta bajacaliforniensis TaxID=148 RepID=UPI000365D5F9|nr:phosphatase PAP2 family protein [Sediminispirochaeta bajacaliforniensis]